jgi:hypothetical protein
MVNNDWRWEMSDEQSCKTPLLDLLRRVPRDGRATHETGKGVALTYYMIPYGLYCHEATEEIERLSLDAIQARGGRQEVMWLLARWYFSSRREGWEEGEKEEEVISGVVDYFANTISGEWPQGWDLKLTLKAIGG